MVGWARRVLLAATVVVLSASACGSGDVASSPGSTGPGPASTGAVAAGGQLLAWCDEVPVPGPIAEMERSMVNPDPTLMGALNRYASDHPDTYGGLWIDQAHGGTVVLAFTDDPS